MCKCVCMEEVWLRVGLPCKTCLPGGIAFAEVVDEEWEPKPEGSGGTCVYVRVCV